jgi:hypothetical protein
MAVILKKGNFDIKKIKNQIEKPIFNEVRKSVRRQKYDIKINKKITYFNKILKKGLFYTAESKKILMELPNFLKIIDSFSKSESELINKSGINKFKNKYEFSVIKESLSKHSNSSLQMFIMNIKTKYGSKKILLKQGSPHVFKEYNRHAYNEVKALYILEGLGVNIVKPYFAFLNKESGKSFIAYEHMDPKRFILVNEFIESSNNNRLLSFLNEFEISARSKLRENNIDIEDINMYNIFMNKKTNKLYAFDNYLVEKDYN